MRIFFTLVTVLALHGSGAAALLIQDVVDDVSYDSYRAYLGYPGDGGNPLFTHAADLDRRWSANHDLARTNILNHFSGLGLNTSLESFTYSGSTYNNVVAVLPGTTRPNDIFIIGAHYDSVGYPGADDNASGVAGIMEAARVLSKFSFQSTIRFIAFDREEQGLCGSTAYITDTNNRDDNILGMISLDMIAYNAGGNNTADIYGRTSSDLLKFALAEAVQTYGGLSIQINGQLDGSDHAPFERNGFQAALLIEDLGNPYYHTAGDNVDTSSYIDYTYATQMTKGAVGYMAGAAILVPEPDTCGLILVGAALFFRARLRRRLPEPVLSELRGGNRSIKK
jgi:hypothetical protein